MRPSFLQILTLSFVVWTSALGQNLKDQPPIWNNRPGVADFEKIENDRLAAAQRSIDQITAVAVAHTIGICGNFLRSLQEQPEGTGSRCSDT